MTTFSWVSPLYTILLNFCLIFSSYSLLSTEFSAQTEELIRVEENVLLPNRALMTPGTKPSNSTEQERKTDSKGGGLRTTSEQVSQIFCTSVSSSLGGRGHHSESQRTITIHLETPSQRARRNITLNMLITCETHTDFQMLDSPFKTGLLG